MTDLANATPANTNEMPTAPADATVEPAQVPEQIAPVEPVSEPNTTPTEPNKETPTQLPEIPEAAPEPTGNAYVDDLLVEFKSNDVDVDKLFGDYLETGNEESIDFKYLEEKVGKLAAQGLIAGVRAEGEKLDAAAEAESKVIYEAAGGEQAWEAILKWIGSGESGLSKVGGEAYNKMLSEGGVQAELAVKELSKMYKQSPGFTQEAQLETGDQTAQVTGIQEISRADYVEQLDVLVRKSGENSPGVQALRKRRLYSMERGVG